MTLPRTCGGCVSRNAIDEAQPVGSCAVANGPRHKDQAACSFWFGLTQLRAPLYGKKAR